MTIGTIERASKTSAPGQYLGFDLQRVRFALHLLVSNGGDRVSLEYLDDIAIHHADGQTTLEQCKSSISGKTLTDKSVDLWKTFGNWADICTTYDLDPVNVSFVLFATPSAPSSFVDDLGGAASEQAVGALLAKIKKWITPSSARREFARHLSRFLALGDEKCVAIIRNFSVIVESDPLEPIRRTLRATLPEAAVVEFCASAIGMAGEFAEKLMRNKRPAVIDPEDFRKKFHAFVRKHNLAGLLNSTTGIPDSAEITRTIASSPMYVRQLDAVSLSPELIVGAVGACLRTTADKINWAAEGEIVEDSLKDFDANLERRFTLVRDGVEDLHGAKDEKQRGRMIYRDCSMVQLPLEDRSLPGYFIEGAYNILADNMRIGWHPSYRALLKED